MIINYFKLYHGAALHYIIDSGERVTINNYKGGSNSSYVLNDSIGLYIKYSNKRLSPWQFSFAKEHQDEILEMKDSYQEVFILLVCGRDGIVCLSFKELKVLLDDNHKEIETISVRRPQGKMYKVVGTDGKLNYKISRSDFPEKVLQSIGKNI